MSTAGSNYPSSLQPSASPRVLGPSPGAESDAAVVYDLEKGIGNIESILSELVRTKSDEPKECQTRPALSIVIPVFNEHDTIASVLGRVMALAIDKQIVIVDDGSTDGTREFLRDLPSHPEIAIFLHASNQGKGSALQTGFRMADGEIIIVQDADQEYDPNDILRVIAPIQLGLADVVYGSRFLSGEHPSAGWLHRQGNALLTWLSNRTTGQNLTDMETCYKAFRRDVLQSLSIRQSRFGFEPEVTAKLARRNIPIAEVSISYHARSWAQGKKIGIRDLFNAIYCILRYAWMD